MAEKKTKKERFLEMVDEMFDDDPGEGGRQETTIVLTGPDALRFLGIGADKPEETPAAGDKPEDKPDDAPKRGKGYFKAE